ncbi:MAG: tyrosine-type recombinase/integrase [Butyrivibrio sp.]|uniref:tyrosine-type recombinase/integrase n=1 Tax=Butyrivibrio sp. TaxID=28121 RepID=UPI001B05F5CC|nr:tyrosine-type recombinase/integrase [Butyrivibrio sp.]MBO6240194.1 tyrosine-type recombinase/integrase [Butyrivibrio sp.]
MTEKNLLLSMKELLSSDILSGADATALKEAIETNIEKLIMEKHHHAISGPDGKGLYYTKNPENLKLKIRAKEKKDLLDKLYAYYYGEKAYTISQLFEPALDYKCKVKGTLDPERDRICFRKYIQGTSFGNMKISSVKGSDIAIFFQTFREKVTRHQLNDIKSQLNMIYDYAFDHDIVTANLSRSFSTGKIKTIAEKNKSHDVYTDIDRHKILKALKDSDNMYEMAISAHFNIDCRSGELFAIHIEDVDFDNSTVFIHREIVTRIDEDGKRHLIEVEHTKTGKDDGARVFPLNENVMKIIRKAKGNRTEGYLFISKRGRFLYLNPYCNTLKKICSQCGVTYRKPHRIRAYTVSAMIKAGIDLETIARKGGHKIETLSAYIKNSKERDNDAQIRAIF